MREVLAIVLFFAIMMVAYAAYSEDVEFTGQLATDTLVYTGKCVLYSLVANTDGANPCTCIAYNNTAESGAVSMEVVVLGADNFGGQVVPNPFTHRTGLYIGHDGTGCTCVAGWRRR
jgi:hypothetical protein